MPMINDGTMMPDIWYQQNRIKYVTFTTSGWSGTAPYTQKVTVGGVTELDVFMPFFMDDSKTEDESIAKKSACNCVSYYDTGDSSITATCLYQKPEADFTVCMKG